MDNDKNLSDEAKIDTSSESSSENNQQTTITKTPAENDEAGPMTEEELAAAFVEPEPKAEEESAKMQEEPGEGNDEDTITSDSPKPRKGLIAAIACFVVIIAGIVVTIVMNSSTKQEPEPVVAIDDLTDEQKEKLGIESTEEKDANSSKIEDEDNYSDEYKKYLELSDEEKAKLEVIPRKEDVPEEKIDEIKDDTDENIIATLPEKFDLRDLIDITVGNQGSYGLCWDFASSTALETHLKLRGIDYNPSELQIDFLSSNLMYGSRELHAAGRFQYFVDMASSIGTISEENFTNLNIDPDGFYGKSNTNLDYLKLAKNDTPLYITKTVNFPSVYKEYGVATNKTDEEMEEFRNLVKAHIMTNGSLYAVMSSPWGFGVPRYCERAMTKCQVNHAMSIIGWDDTYPKEKFARIGENGTRIDGTPVHDGAYLVLNSWGEDWDGSDAEKGVFYVSYDEYNIETQLSGIVSTSLDNAKKLDSITSQVAKDVINEKLGFYIIEKNGEEYISDYALDKVSYLDLGSRELTDDDLSNIIGIFQNLSSINISNNNISDLSALLNLKNLGWVYFSKNNVTDISSLCDMKNLKGFDLSYNKITDVSCLADMIANQDYPSLNISGNIGVVGYEDFTNLNSLTADDLGLENLEPLRKLTKLTSLSVRNNNIKTLDGLSTAKESFYSLNVSGNKNLESLDFNVPVSYLNVQDANLKDISILNDIEADMVLASKNDFGDLSKFNNKAISFLDLSENKNLSNISAIGTVSGLVLSDCGITSFSELSGLDNVQNLTLNNNNISSFNDTDNVKNAVTLNLTGNNLTSLNGVSQLEKIQTLYIDNNQISSLTGIEKLAELSSVSADNNNIKNADELLDLENLHFASLNNNELTSIPNFTKQVDLYLALADNPLESATLPKDLMSINLKDCNLDTIDYSAIEKLVNVNLEGNPSWKDYSSLISKSISGQQKIGRSYPHIGISTDYNFSKEELDNLDSIPGLSSDASWYINLKEYSNEFEKSPDGTVDLEKHPNERKMFMPLLESGLSLNGFTIDKAATRLTLEDKAANSVILERGMRINNNTHLSANRLVLNFKST